MRRLLIILVLTCLLGLHLHGASQSAPIIIPHPWQMTVSGDVVDLGTVTMSYPAGEDRLRAAGDAWVAGLPKAAGQTQVTFRALPQSASPLQKAFADLTPESLGDQGYFLSVQRGDGITQVEIAAANERARFYGLQTLKQLVDGTRLHVVQIADKPSVSRRGIPSGLWWWVGREELAKRMASYKMNYIYQGGSLLNGTFGGPPSRVPAQWRQPFTDAERRELESFAPIAHANFIDISFQMCPRGTPPTTYCGDEDIDLNVKKLSELYQMGYRHFGVNFDDLQNIGQDRIITDADKAKFGDDIGEAHRYFVQAVYDRLKAKHPDISFSFCPLQYHVGPRSASSSYIKAITKLSPEITLVVVPSGDLNTVKEILGRPPLVWDNFYARWEKLEKVPLLLPPHPANPQASDNTIKGYVNLPLIPRQEDAGMVSWASMADFMWAPDRYDPEASEKVAILRAIGSLEAAERVKTFMAVADHVEQMAYPTDKAGRLAAIQSDQANLKSLGEELALTVPQKFRPAIEDTARRMTARLNALAERMKQQPYPVRVNKVESGSITLGQSAPADWARATTLSDFHEITGRPAKFKTTVQLLHDGSNLLLRAVCDDPNPQGIMTGAKSYRDDCLEMTFMPDLPTQAENQEDRRGGRGQHVLATAGGHSTAGGPAFAKITDTGWTIEMAIPLKRLGIASAQPNTQLLFNICRARQQMPDTENSSWALLFQSRFAAPPSKLVPMVLE